MTREARAEVAFFGGNLLTQDPRQPVATALAVARHRIIAVGSDDDIDNVCGPATRRINLGGATMVPGFNDAHVHVWKVGQLRTRVLDMRGAASMADMAERLRAFAAALPPGAWFQARGYNEALLAEGRHPTRVDIDAMLPDRPGIITRTCGHMAVVNSAALALAGITRATTPPAGGDILRDDSGEPNGRLIETALGLVARVVPKPTIDDLGAMIESCARHHLSLGITSATDPAAMPDLLDAYRALDREQRLPYRVNVLAIRRPDGGRETLPLPERTITNRLRIDGVKFFADGGLSGATAALRVPYRHTTTADPMGRGVLRFERDELLELAMAAQTAGLRIGTHAIGDRAIDLVLDVYEALERQAPGGPRHRIEHFGLPDAPQIARVARGGWIAVPQAIFLAELGVNFRRYLPDEYLPRCYPLRRVWDAGIAVALSSDAPVVRDDNPLAGMAAALLRRDAEGVAIASDQSLKAQECLWAYTMAGAIASGDEGNRGSLSPGKWADLAIIDGDLLATPPELLTTLRVRQTWLDGALVYEG